MRLTDRVEVFLHTVKCPCDGSPLEGIYMRVTACRFCGVPTDVPHETQELCIAALHDEIARMRDMVTRVKKPVTRPEVGKEEPVGSVPRDPDS